MNKEMKKLTLLYLFLALSSSCVASWKSSCWTDALYEASVVSVRENGTPVRIALQHTNTKGIDHAEAQIFIDGEWKCLGHDNNLVYVKDGKTRYEPYKYITLKEAMEHHIDVFERTEK